MKRILPGFFIAILLSCSSQSTTTSTEKKPPAARKASYLGILYSQAPRGVVIVDVFQNSPAQKAELSIGDTILSLNGGYIAGVYTMKSRILEMQPGSEVVLEVIKFGAGNTVQTVRAVLEEMPDVLPPGMQNRPYP